MFKEYFNMNLFENGINYCLRQVHPTTLDMEDKSLVDCLHTLFMTKSNKITIHGFEIKELDFINDPKLVNNAVYYNFVYYLLY